MIVGSINSAFNYSLYAILIFSGLGHIIASTGAFAAGMIFNFKAHAKFVFKTKNRNSFYLYIVSWIVIYFVNIIVLDLMVRSGVDSYLAGALLMPPLAVLAFVVLRFIVFRPNTTSD